MLAFTVWWTLSSSLCCVIASIIARQSFLKNRDGFIFITLIVYWILLGLVQWQLLNPHISNAYIWGLVTIEGGIVSSFLLILGLRTISNILCKNISFIPLLGGSKSNQWEFLLSITVLIISLFGSGFLFGWQQSIVLQYLLHLKYLNSIIPLITISLVTGFTWLLIVPILGFIFLFLAKDNVYICILLTIICAVFINLTEGLLIRQILFFI